MGDLGKGRGGTFVAAPIRARLASRLRSRRAELEALLLARLAAVPGGDLPDDYMVGFPAAAADLTEQALSEIAAGDMAPGRLPPGLVAQVRRAAGLGIPVEVLVRGQVAAERALSQLVIEEGDSLGRDELAAVLRSRDAQVDALLAETAAEYEAELKRLRRSSGQRLAKRVERLLSREHQADPAGIPYDFGGWHVGAIATGVGAQRALGRAEVAMSCQMLLVPRDGGDVWAWFAAPRPPAIADAEAVLADSRPDLRIAFGEPRRGIEGWRLTHGEALAAMRVARRQGRTAIRSSQVLLLAALLREEALVCSLREDYIAPLDRCDGSAVDLRRTLGAYFAADGNAAAAAASLRVTRQTVSRRLRRIEEALGRFLGSCRPELEVALMLEQLDDLADCP